MASIIIKDNQNIDTALRNFQKISAARRRDFRYKQYFISRKTKRILKLANSRRFKAKFRY